MLEDMALGDDSNMEEAIPLPNCSATILRKVIQWATYHKEESVRIWY